MYPKRRLRLVNNTSATQTQENRANRLAPKQHRDRARGHTPSGDTKERLSKIRKAQ